jgi:hypothetical protein
VLADASFHPRPLARDPTERSRLRGSVGCPATQSQAGRGVKVAAPALTAPSIDEHDNQAPKLLVLCAIGLCGVLAATVTGALAATNDEVDHAGRPSLPQRLDHAEFHSGRAGRVVAPPGHALWGADGGSRLRQLPRHP